MSIEELVAAIDKEISRLKSARALLSGSTAITPTRKATEPAPAPAKKVAKRRRMSAAGRKRIAEAQRKRWAAQKKASK